MNCVGRSSNLEEDSELLEAGNGGESEAGHLLAEQHPLVTPFQDKNSLLDLAMDGTVVIGGTYQSCSLSAYLE